MYSSILVLNSQLSLKDTLVLYKNIGFTVHLSDINILKIGFGSRMMKVILVIVYIQRNIQTINFLKNACNHVKEKILFHHFGNSSPSKGEHRHIRTTVRTGAYQVKWLWRKIQTRLFSCLYQKLHQDPEPYLSRSWGLSIRSGVVPILSQI